MSDEQTKQNIARNICRLLALRESPENTQAWLGERCGESRMRINLYARGEKMASAGVISRIAEALEVSVDELIGSPPRARRRKLSA